VGAVFVVIGQKWTEMTLLSPADLEEDAYFGHSVGLKGPVMAVGALGLVCVYGRAFGQMWAIRSILHPASSSSGLYFGKALGLAEFKQFPSLSNNSAASNNSARFECVSTRAVLAVGVPGPGEGSVFLFATEPYFSGPHCPSSPVTVDEGSGAQLRSNDSGPQNSFGDSLAFGEPQGLPLIMPIVVHFIMAFEFYVLSSPFY